MIRPVACNARFLPGQVDTARHMRSASANQEPRVVNAVNLPRDQRNISAPNATPGRSGPALAGVAVGGILVSCFAVFLLLLVPWYLKRRRRRRENTRTDNVENGQSQLASFESGDEKTLSVSDSNHMLQSNPTPAFPVARPTPKKVTFVGLPTSPSPRAKATDERIRNSHLPTRPPPILKSPGRADRGAWQSDTAVSISHPASRMTGERIRKQPRPPPLLISPRRTDYEARQGGSSETADPANPPALPSSPVTGERIRKPPRPARPPPLLLSPGYANYESRQGGSSENADPVNPPVSPLSGERIGKSSLPTRPPLSRLHSGRIRRANSVAKSTMAITPADEDDRGSVGSLLPSPRDRDATAFESSIFLRSSIRSSFTGSVRRASAFKAGLPRTPRETRMQFKVRSLRVA